MHFLSDINRPPYETADAYLQTTQGYLKNRLYKKLENILVRRKEFSWKARAGTITGLQMHKGRRHFTTGLNQLW